MGRPGARVFARFYGPLATFATTRPSHAELMQPDRRHADNSKTENDRAGAIHICGSAHASSGGNSLLTCFPVTRFPARHLLDEDPEENVRYAI